MYTHFFNKSFFLITVLLAYSYRAYSGMHCSGSFSTPDSALQSAVYNGDKDRTSHLLQDMVRNDPTAL
jgi:hypothetical protein